MEEPVISVTGVGFIINPYNLCFANKMVNGKKIMVVWHIDDLKIFYEEVISSCIVQLSGRYGKGDPLNITCGKLHDHLGTILDYIQKGKVKVDMIQYLKPAENHLFDVNDFATPLSEEIASPLSIPFSISYCSHTKGQDQTYK